MNNYQNVYQKYTDEKLKKVLSERYKYNEEAISAALNECNERGINIEDIDQIPPVEDVPSNNKFIEKSWSIIKEYFPSFEPRRKSDSFVTLDNEEVTALENNGSERLHKKLVGAFVIFSLYNILTNYSLLWFMLTDNQAEWDIPTVFTIYPMFTLPVFTILFYMRNKLGWIGVLFQFITAAINNGFMAIIYGSIFIDNLDYEYYNFATIAGICVIMILFMLVNFYIIFLLSKRKIRSKIFSVSDNQHFQYMFASIVFGGLIFYIYYQSASY